jgi:hypothetical protein
LKLSRERNTTSTAASQAGRQRPAQTSSTQAGNQGAASGSANQPGSQSSAPNQNQSSTQAGSQQASQATTQAALSPVQPSGELSPEQRAALAEDEREQLKQARQELNDAIQLVRGDVDLYKGIGFTPLRLQQVKDFLSSLIPDKSTEDPWNSWVQARKHDIKALVGWIIMTILLSIGAPFWQDTLESLFGVKNLLRKKGDIQNVEQEPGTGQPKP